MAGPLMLLVLPGVWLALATMSLNYFKIAYVLFGRLVDAKPPLPLWSEWAQPFLQKVAAFLQASLGPAEKLSFNMTHILLCAQLIASIYYLERLRAAVLSRRA